MRLFLHLETHMLDTQCTLLPTQVQLRINSLNLVKYDIAYIYKFIILHIYMCNTAFLLQHSDLFIITYF